MDEIERRLNTLEQAVARLQGELASSAANASGTTGRDSAEEARSGGTDDRFWMLEELKRQVPQGAVGFAGHVDAAAGRAEWQWARTTDDLLEAEWDDAATPLAALGHPVRLRLLHLVLSGVTSTSELAEAEGLGTTGQLHHHLRTLVSGGWLTSTGRGRYGVPPARVVPLLVIIATTIPA